jgi:hypothetical protein
MPHRLTYDFRRETEWSFQHASRACLAIVDLESYPAFIAEKSDGFDLLGHLCTQMDALTATMWETPDANLRLRLILARDDRAVGNLHQSRHHVFAAGWVRSSGRLCLADQEQLLHSARRRGRGLLKPRRFSKAGPPRTLLVPPGTYDVTVFSGVAEGGKDEPNYIVVLRHHPPPPPRLQPVRLHSRFLQDVAETASAITSHAKDWTASAGLA